MRFLLSVFLWLVTLASAWSQDSFVQLYEGRIKLQLGAQVRFVSHQDAQNPLTVKLILGERIQTGQSTRAEVILRGGEEIIQLRAGSLFTVNEVNEVETKLAIPIGKAAFRVDPERRLKRRFEVRTVTAVIGVRGTDFVMGVGDGQTSMLTLSGTVEMSSSEISVIQVQVNEGQASKIEVGKAPTPPISIPLELQSFITSSDSAESFQLIDFPPAKDLEKAAEELEQQQDSEEANNSGTQTGEVPLDEILKAVKEAVENTTKDAERIIKLNISEE